MSGQDSEISRLEQAVAEAAIKLRSLVVAMRDPANRAVCEYCHGGRLLTRHDGTTVECVECFGSGTVPKRDLPLMGAGGATAGTKK